MIQHLHAATAAASRVLLLVLLLTSLPGCVGTPGAQSCSNQGPPFSVEPGLFDQDRRADLGLARIAGTETVTIFRPGSEGNAYNHGVVLIPFNGRLYAQWQTSKRDEDAPDTHVAYSVSPDGRDWTEPVVLAETLEQGIRTSGGWWTSGETLIAYINVWPDPGDGPKGGFTEYVTSSDGHTWSRPNRVLAADGEPVDGVIEQDPHALADGRIIGAFHMRPGLVVAPWFTDDPLGVTGWRMGAMSNLPHDAPYISREIEPSIFTRADGAIVMVFRDQAGSHRKLASVSCDRGVTWSAPVLTDMPDARTKQSAGNLPDGTAYLVGNPVPRRDRFPLVLTLSGDGRHFDTAWLLQDGGGDLQPMRFAGRFKSAGYSYTKSVVWQRHLYVAYATNKEVVQLTRVPLARIIRPDDRPVEISSRK